MSPADRGSEPTPAPPPPRIAPGRRRDIGPINSVIVGVIGRATGGKPPAVFTTLARHRRLFRAWLRFAGRLMPRGTLARRESELVILRVAHLCGSEYEWRHHERLGKRAGLEPAEIERVREGPDADGWSADDATLLRAVDELHTDKEISDGTWQALAARLSEKQLIELCMLAGHYEMLAGTLNTLRVRDTVSTLALAAILLLALPALAGATVKVRSSNGLTVLSQKRLNSRLLEAKVRTTALPGPAAIRVLLPSGYARHPKRRYPVLYLFHGTSGGANDWTDAGDAEKTTAGRNLIVVMPDIALNRDGGGWCTNWPNGRYRWETFHVSQLVPWADHNLRTRRARTGRAIAGLSQGGFCSTSYAARHPDMFGTALAFSGAPDIAYSADAIVGATAIINAIEVGDDGVPPNTIFGDRLTNEINWKAHDPATLAENLRTTDLYLYTGNGLPGPFDSTVDPSASSIEAAVYRDNEDFQARLRTLGIPSHYTYYGNGTHTFAYWARDLRWSIGPIMHRFAHTLPVPAAPTYRSAENSYGVYGWRVTMHRDAREFSTLKARCRSFALSGSGSATVRTPGCLKPGTRYRVELTNQDGTRSLTLRAGHRGRLSIHVPLGPSNPYQQFTVQSVLSGTDVFTTKASIRRLR